MTALYGANGKPVSSVNPLHVTLAGVQPAIPTVDQKRHLVGQSTYRPEALYQTLTLAAGENNACALAYDRENALFVGCNTTPARIVKVDATTMQRLGAMTLPVGAAETRVAALVAISPDIIIHVSYTNPFVVTRINGRTMKVSGQLTGADEAVSDKFGRPITFDGEFVYIGCDSTAGKVVKINPYTMTRVGGVTFDTGINNVMSMVYLNGYLYAGCETNPAYIVKINPRNMAVVSSVQLAVGHNNARAMTTDGRHLYVGCMTSPLQVVKFDPETMAEVAAYVAGAGENELYSMTTDGQHVYAGTWADPSVLIQLNPADMTRVSATTLNPGYPSDLMFISPHLITSTDTNPGQVVRLLQP